MVERGAHWLRLASQPAVRRRALAMCLLVGTTLVVINHGPAIAAGAITPTLTVQVVLTYVVPYLVSSASSVASVRDKDAD